MGRRALVPNWRCPLSEKRRAILCLLSIFLTSVLFALSDAYEPAAKQFHRWSQGLFVTFILILLIAMFATLRGRLANTSWVIMISAALSSPAATLAYLVYFAAFEPQLLLNSLGRH